MSHPADVLASIREVLNQYLAGLMSEKECLNKVIEITLM